MGQTASTEFSYAGQLAADKVPQSVEIAVADEKVVDAAPSAGLPRRNLQLPHELVRGAAMTPGEKADDASTPSPATGGVLTIWDAFQRGVERHGDRLMLGARTYETTETTETPVDTGDVAEKPKTKVVTKRGEYVWSTYQEVHDEVVEVGAGLAALGVEAKDNVGIFATNTPHWLKSALALYSRNARVVSLYATLGEDAVEFIIGHADVAVVFVSYANLPQLIACLPKLPHVTHVVQFDTDEKLGNTCDRVRETDVAACAACHGVVLSGYSDLRANGKAAPVTTNSPAESDLCYVMYTSGTTGQPKGAMLTHGNVLATVGALLQVTPSLDETTVHISYLPLAHIFETAVEVAVMTLGGAIGFFQGDIRKLTDDLGSIQPTVLCGVPRVFQRIYQKVMGGVAGRSWIVRYLFNNAYATQCDNVRAGRARNAGYDAKFFAPIAARIGLGRVRTIVTGAAPCPPYLCEFLKVVGNADVIQGYGMTETAGGMTAQRSGDVTVGHCGPPVPCCELRLRDVPEMNYFHTDQPYPRGEVLCRGPNVFVGYFKNEAETAATFTDGDWLCTGDIGQWNANGTLSIIDRRKNIFKLSQGEYVAAEKVEGVYGKSGVVGQIFVYGNSFKSMIVAVVVPNAEAVHAYAVERGWWRGESTPGSGDDFLTEFEALCSGEHAHELKTYLHERLSEHNGELKGFEKVKAIIVEGRLNPMLIGFTEANQCMTPTFKLRRPFLLKRYLKQLKQAYADLGEPATTDEQWPGEK